MKRLLILIVMITIFAAGNALAQSAKFTSIWSDDGEIVRSEACTAEGTIDPDNYCDDLDLDNTGEVTAITFATIKVPQAKELLVGLSAQVELFTETEVRGKKGTTSMAVAFAEGGVELFACSSDAVLAGCYIGQPGRVVLASRKQELEATLAGVIESCTFPISVDPDSHTGQATFNLGQCDVEDEAIRLALTTMSANHFNFVFPNLPQGTYHVIARFSADSTASTEVWCEEQYTYCETEYAGAAAGAYAVIGKYMMTVQEVRAIKDEGGDPPVVE